MSTEKDFNEQTILSEDELAQITGGQDSLNESMGKLSNGMKIKSSSDDSSGYQISERMRVQIHSSDSN